MNSERMSGEGRELRELFERMGRGDYVCPDCRHMVDSPEHEMGCERGRIEQRQAAAAGATRPEPTINQATADRLAFAVEDYLCRMHGIISSQRAAEFAPAMLRYVFGLTEGDDWMTDPGPSA